MSLLRSESLKDPSVDPLRGYWKAAPYSDPERDLGLERSFRPFCRRLVVLGRQGGAPACQRTAPDRPDTLVGGEANAVSGRLRTIIKDRHDRSSGAFWTTTADDFCEFSVELQDSATASVPLFSVSRNDLGNHLPIFGSDGTLILAKSERLRLSQDGTNLISSRGVMLLLPDVIAHLSTGRPLPERVTFQNALQNQVIIDAVRQSSGDRSWIDLPTQKEPRSS